MGCGASRTSEQQPPTSSLPALQSAGASATVVVESAPAPKDSSKHKDSESGIPGTTVVKAWTADVDGTLCFPEVDDPEFAIPALESDKLPLAICISGGGFRAATLGLGWLRALHIVGVLKKAKYLCTCSGSSWLSAALNFQRLVPLDDFLGPHLPPEQCSLEALAEVGHKGRSAAAVLADAEPLREYLKGLPGGLAEGGDEGLAQQARSWTKAMAGAFLQPYGLGDTDQSTVTLCGTKGGVEASVWGRSAGVGRANVFTADLQALPFPIIAQVFMLPSQRFKYYPLEWTPLYSGCPVRVAHTSPKLGPGWVETLGVNADLVGKPEPIPGPKGAVSGGGTALAVRVRPVGPASLGEATGTSSAYMAYKWALGKSKAGRTMFKALGFNTAQYFDQQDWASSHVQLADGGAVDYFALHPALRRRVPAIIVCSASRTEIDDPKFANYMKELAGLFGCWPGSAKPDKDSEELSPEEYNTWQQVFPTEGFAQLVEALREGVQAGGAPVHVGEYQVLDNAALGIRSGWRVRVMWVINARQPTWEAALPADTRRKLEADRTTLRAKVEEALNPLDADTLREFPYVSTFAMNYTPQLVNLMAAHAGHMIVSNGAQLGKLMQAAEEGQLQREQQRKQQQQRPQEQEQQKQQEQDKA